MITSIILLSALVAWHANTSSGKAMQFAGCYTVVLSIFDLLAVMAGGSWVRLLIIVALRFGLATGYFWLLDRFDGLNGWLIAIVGGLALGFIA
jgi:hypothetical protein